MKLYLKDPLGVDALLFNDLSESSGLSPDMIKFMGCLLLSFPVSYLQGTVVPAGTLRHLWSVFFGVATSLVCFAEDSIHPLLSAAIAYVLMRVFPTQPLIVMIATVVHMSCAHLYSFWFEYGAWNIDYTMAQMVLMVKLQTLSWSVADGHRKNPKLHPKSDMEADKITPELMPSLLEFFSYVLFYPSFIAGPCFTYKHYRNWANGLVPVPAGRGLACFYKFVAAIFLMFLNKAVLPKMPNDLIIEPENSGNPSIMDFPLWQRLFYIWFSIVLTRTKYFFVWYLSDACCILSGLGYNGTDDKCKTKGSIWCSMFETSVDSSGRKWDGCSNGNYFKVELAQNLKGVTDNWNMGVNYWLKNDVYLRLALVLGDRSQLPVLLTQTMSAFWHGFYPGYYFFFVSGSLFTIAAREARSKIRPYMQSSSSVASFYNVVTFVATGMSLNYIGVPFVFMDWRATLGAWQRVYCLPHIAAVLLVVVCKLIPKQQSKPKQA
eukprot:Rhum_TRINITY_DN2043_c0_g1::Rhum_TRINITY_DN2043_c0_g1_i1::g.5440::m.5440/K13517/MBOAT1_2; lysophospholipid acyltransferase 1/2